MARTFIVSDRHNTFFTENNIKVGTQIPTEGTYRKGDIVVNIGNNTANEAMWICVEAGTPGTWEVVGAGVGGTGGGSSLVVLNESVFINEPVNEVSLGSLVGKISNKDKLIVHHNSIHLMEGIDYEVDSKGTKIVKLTEGPWNESGEDDSLFSFELLKNVESIDGNEIVVDTKLTSMVNNVIVNTPTTEVEIGIDGFNKDNDTLLVFKNGVIMVEGVEYNVSGDNTKIISINEVWNESNVENYGITFVVFKEVVIYNGENGSVTMDMLGNDVKDTINGLITITELNAGNIDKNIEAISKIDLSNYATKEDLENVDVDLSGYATKEDLVTTQIKTDVGVVLQDTLNTTWDWIQDNQDWLQDVNDVAYDAQGLARGCSNTIGTPENLLTNEKGNIVGAINELFQSANNGKELIASAIGEPLDSNDTFSAMSNDINGLLSTFKTNMMNSGVMVESGDKFKALIDKIATLADNEGKGIQISTGHFDITTLQPATEGMGVLTSNQLNFNPPLNFTPDRVILSIPKLQLGTSVGGDYANHSIDSEIHSSLNNRFTVYDENGKEINMYIGTVINDITAEGFVLNAGKNNTNYALTTPEGIDWLAIGVGEDDTTLRDSLANILEEEGVSVTEEDTMADLITKVDEEFDRKNANKGLDIISATKLPATGRENQICVITNNPVDSFIFSKDEPSNKRTGLVWFKAEEQSSITTLYSGTTNNVNIQYHLRKCFYYNGTSFTEIKGYIYNNGWKSLSKSYVFIDKDGLINFKRLYDNGGEYSKFVSGKGVVYNVENINGSTRYESQWVSNTKIDFSPYKTLTFEFTVTAPSGDWSYEGFVCCGYGTTALSNYFHSAGAWTGGQISHYNMSGEDSTDLSGKKETMTFDISGVNTECYVGVEFAAYLVTNVVLTSISLS